MTPFILGTFNIRSITHELQTIGATSIRILNEDFRLGLLEEAKGYTFAPADPVVGSGDRIVRQQLELFEDFPHESNYALLKQAFQNFLNVCLSEAAIYPFETRLQFNSMILQKYHKGSTGITPHRDGLRYVNLVCIFIISGEGRFYICPDRSGSGSREVAASPGDVVLLKAPGFLGSRDRPFHYVADIQTVRYTLGLRQDDTVAQDRTQMKPRSCGFPK